MCLSMTPRGQLHKCIIMPGLASMSVIGLLEGRICTGTGWPCQGSIGYNHDFDAAALSCCRSNQSAFLGHQSIFKGFDCLNQCLGLQQKPCNFWEVRDHQAAFPALTSLHVAWWRHTYAHESNSCCKMVFKAVIQCLWLMLLHDTCMLMHDTISQPVSVQQAGGSYYLDQNDAHEQSLSQPARLTQWVFAQT